VTPLERALRERIQAEGPITVEAYMEACNAYYYTTRDPFGAKGDFTTAPEISQMFGEMVGAALADCWKRAGEPAEAIYVELGPGRGTLASDALRVLRPAGLDPEIHFVETSPMLRDAQGELHSVAGWHESLLTMPPGLPLLIVANEFFDALPVRQFVNGVERRVAVAAGGLAFDRDGDVVEDSPVRDAYAWEIGAQLDVRGGVAIIIDYGHPMSAPGDTLQAVRGHEFASLLANPGEQDLTAHVDFETLAKAASVGEVKVSKVVTQGEWLKRLGIETRAEALARANPDRADDVRSALDRLTAPDQMGELFKVMAVHSPKWPVPAGFA
jgi:NADH dehydrogenase [ubiquinone] 1 alpha subcomplex assembly factor 7